MVTGVPAAHKLSYIITVCDYLKGLLPSAYIQRAAFVFQVKAIFLRLFQLLLRALLLTTYRKYANEKKRL